MSSGHGGSTAHDSTYSRRAFEVQLAVDAIGGIDKRTEHAAFARMTAAGAVTTSVITLAAELAGDFTLPYLGR